MSDLSAMLVGGVAPNDVAERGDQSRDAAPAWLETARAVVFATVAAVLASLLAVLTCLA